MSGSCFARLCWALSVKRGVFFQPLSRTASGQYAVEFCPYFHRGGDLCCYSIAGWKNCESAFCNKITVSISKPAIQCSIFIRYWLAVLQSIGSRDLWIHVPIHLCHAKANVNFERRQTKHLLECLNPKADDALHHRHFGILHDLHSQSTHVKHCFQWSDLVLLDAAADPTETPWNVLKAEAVSTLVDSLTYPARQLGLYRLETVVIIPAIVIQVAIRTAAHNFIWAKVVLLSDG